MTPLPQLPKTAAAIEACDAFEAAIKWDTQSTEEWFDAEEQLGRLGEAVGAAFGEETKDRNNPETCRGCIRLGPRVPAPGAELSFVRKAVARYKERLAVHQR